MRNILSAIGGIISLIVLVSVEIGLSYILPFPYSKINLIFAVLIIWMLWRKSGMVVWISFFANFIVELFAASPFGLIVFSGTISMLLGYWFFQNIFTNRSWFAAIVLTIITIFLYRLIYAFGLLILFWGNAIRVVPWKMMMSTLLWEELFTVLLVGMIYVLLTRYSRQFRSEVIEAQRFKI